MRVCARGCLQRGVHGPECKGEECKGCAVVEVERGYLCDRCARRLREAVEGCPELVRHIRASMVPMPSQVYDREIVTGGGSSFGQPPMNVDAIDACDYILATARGWAKYFGDPFPYETMQATIPAGSSPEQVAALVRWPVGYLIEKFDEVLNSSRHVGWMCANFLDWPDEPGEWSVKKAASRWPRELAGYWSTQPCRECGRNTVRVVPPAEQFSNFTFVCKGCGWRPFPSQSNLDDAQDYYTKGQR